MARRILINHNYNESWNWFGTYSKDWLRSTSLGVVGPLVVQRHGSMELWSKVHVPNIKVWIEPVEFDFGVGVCVSNVFFLYQLCCVGWSSPWLNPVLVTWVKRSWVVPSGDGWQFPEAKSAWITKSTSPLTLRIAPWRNIRDYIQEWVVAISPQSSLWEMGAFPTVKMYQNVGAEELQC